MNDPRNPSLPGAGHSANPQSPAHPPQHSPQHPPQHPPQPMRAAPVVPSARPGITAVPILARPKLDDEAIALVDDVLEEADASSSPAKKIKFGPEMGHKHHDWKRKTVANNTGACRIKTFHGKYSDQGLEYMDDVINEWLDAHPDVEIKFVTSTVGVFEGKIRDPALVLNVWY